LQAAAKIRCCALVIDTESSAQALGKTKDLAEAMGAELISLTAFEAGYDFPILLKKSAK